MGGPQGPSLSSSPEVSPQKKAGRPMGPSTPRCSPQNFVVFVMFRMFWPKVLCVGFFGEICQ